MSCWPLLSIPLSVRGPDLALRVKSLRPQPSQVVSWAEIAIASDFQGPALRDANLMGTLTCNYHDNHYYHGENLAVFASLLQLWK